MYQLQIMNIFTVHMLFSCYPNDLPDLQHSYMLTWHDHLSHPSHSFHHIKWIGHVCTIVEVVSMAQYVYLSSYRCYFMVNYQLKNILLFLSCARDVSITTLNQLLHDGFKTYSQLLCLLALWGDFLVVCVHVIPLSLSFYHFHIPTIHYFTTLSFSLDIIHFMHIFHSQREHESFRPFS